VLHSHIIYHLALKLINLCTIVFTSQTSGVLCTSSQAYCTMISYLTGIVTWSLVYVCTRAGRFSWKQIDLIWFDLAKCRFDSILLRQSGLRPFMNWSALSNVLTKLSTVISLGLAVNAQWC